MQVLHCSNATDYAITAVLGLLGGKRSDPSMLPKKVLCSAECKQANGVLIDGKQQLEGSLAITAYLLEKHSSSSPIAAALIGSTVGNERLEVLSWVEALRTNSCLQNYYL